MTDDMLPHDGGPCPVAPGTVDPRDHYERWLAAGRCNGRVGMSERIRASDAAAMLGITVRTVQSLAQRGIIPAAKVGGVYTFDPLKLRRWLDHKEVEQCRESEVDTQKASTKGEGSSGSGRPSTESSIEKAYEQAMQRWRKGKQRQSVLA